MTETTLDPAETFPAQSPLDAREQAAVIQFGHDVDMAIFDLSRRKISAVAPTSNLRALSQTMWSAATQIASRPRQTWSSSTTGFALSAEHSPTSGDLADIFENATALARDCGFASTSNLSDDESEALTKTLTALVILNLDISGYPSTIESYEARTRQAMAVATAS